MQSDYQYPRLVRVVWKDRQTRQVRSFVAANFAYDVVHARDIGEAILLCMVPCHKQLNIAMQTAMLARNANKADMHAHDTPWETFYSEVLGHLALPAPKGAKRKSASGAR